MWSPAWPIVTAVRANAVMICLVALIGNVLIFMQLVPILHTPLALCLLLLWQSCQWQGKGMIVYSLKLPIQLLLVVTPSPDIAVAGISQV